MKTNFRVRLLVLGLNLLAAGSLVAGQSLFTAPGVVRGTVTFEGKLVGEAQVALAPAGTRASLTEAMLPQTPPVIVKTDGDGRFTFQNVAPGSYILTAEGGYSTPSRRASLPRALILAARQEQELTLTLTPSGSIGGEVRDSTGSPASGARVAAMRLNYGTIRFGPSIAEVASANADTQGQYVLTGLDAGEYYIRAELFGRPIPEPAVSPDDPPAQSRTSYITTYFPEANRLSTAAPLTLAPGEVRMGVDFSVKTARTSKISGAVVSQLPGEVGQPTAPFSLYLVPRGTDSLDEEPRELKNTAEPTRIQAGEFELIGVPTGTYDLYAVTQRIENGNPVHYAGRVEIGNTDRNISEAVIVIRPGVALSVRASGIETQAQIMNPVSVWLQPRTLLPPSLMSSIATQNASSRINQIKVGIEPQPQQLPPGLSFPVPQTFTYRNLPEGVYDVGSTALVSASLLDVTVAGRSNIRDGVVVRVGGQSAETAHVNLIIEGIQIRGEVRRADGQLAGGAILVAAPEPSQRHNPMRYYATRADASGAFDLNGVTAGSYTLFAFEPDGLAPAALNGAFLNPQFATKYEHLGTPVALRTWQAPTLLTEPLRLIVTSEPK